MPDRDSSSASEFIENEAFWRRYLEDPFSVRGIHEFRGGWAVRTYQPGAFAVDLIPEGGVAPIRMSDQGSGFFVSILPERCRYVFRIHWPTTIQHTEDPYSFGLILPERDLHLFSEGSLWTLGRTFGAIPASIEGVTGVSFAVWAPNARRVSVVGDFNDWDGKRHPMRLRSEAGVWEIFIPNLGAGERYKFEIVGRDGQNLPLKADPVARMSELPPATASIVVPSPQFQWHDGEWIEARQAKQSAAAPISIYEIHAGSWRRPRGTTTGTLNWDGLIGTLIPYVREMAFTHIELMPIMEHPFTGSWGYQPLSQFAPSARYGTPEDFARFVDACHEAGIGVILDWVPAHFPNDAHGLARFDGTALYEHADPREGFHPDWNTYVYNLGRSEVQGFLIASALWWIEQFHIDGIRVDAVASMLYRDYSRKEGEWLPNRFGGRENLEAIEFLKRLNSAIADRCPGAITIAEESTAWPGVTARPSDGGLGFSFKWNMGWMHDTLRYIGHDPVHRKWHHHDMTFGLLYAFSEKYVLPLSHDEVVYGKGSLYQRVPGDIWQKFATLRAYFGFMWTHPGKKLLFMGDEFASKDEWNHDGELEWAVLNDTRHTTIRALISDLNQLYRGEPALHRTDALQEGFQWLILDDVNNSVFAYARSAGDEPMLVVAINMTPIARPDYNIGVPLPGRWMEILNTDSTFYGGSNVGNLGALDTMPASLHGHTQMLSLTLPPLATIVLKHAH